LRNAFKYIHDGNLGPIEYVRGFHFRVRKGIGKVAGPQKPPPEVDYNLWLGPAPQAPLMRKELHYDWHWQWPYGNGELGNNGVHQLDLATWVLGLDKFPERVFSLGGRFLYEDDGETPNTHVTYYDYKPIPIVYELRNLPRKKGDTASDNLNGHRGGIQVKCRDGSYFGFNTGGWVYDNDDKKVKQFPGDGGKEHHQNFIDAVRARKPDMVAAPVAAGHLSAGLCHLGNISHRLGKPANGRNIDEAVGGIPVLEETVERFHEHMLVNGVDVSRTPRILGPWLSFEPGSETFTGELAEEADALMRREEYRKGFEIPGKV
jgi:hypothetical protein